MPTRVVRDAILDSERYHSVDKPARLAYLELLLCVDDFALMPLSDVYLKRHTTAFEGMGKTAIDTILAALHDADLVRIYETAGARFGFLPRFRNSPRAKKPKWPVPPDTPAFAEFWQHFPPEFREHLKKEAAKNNDLAKKTHNTRTQMHANVPETETETELRNRERDSRADAKTGSSRPAKPSEPTAGALTFEAYARAFKARYGTEPVRNKVVNSCMKQVAERLGADEAPQVAAYYVAHNGPLYVNSAHAVQALVKDAEKLRTEWFTGRKVTTTAKGFAQQEREARGSILASMTGGRLGTPNNGSRADSGNTLDMEAPRGQQPPRLD